MNRTVEVLGVDMDVEYEATPYIPACYEHDHEGGEVEITSVSVEGIDITQLISEWTVAQIQMQLEAIDHDAERREEAECASESYWDSRRDDLAYI